MSTSDHDDVLIVGSGEAGKYLAWHMASAGHRTAVIERKLIGGSCPNTNCLPSKNEIWSAKVAELVRQASRFGSVTGPTTVDMGLVLERKRAMVDDLVAMHLNLFKTSGAELIMGHARLTVSGDRVNPVLPHFPCCCVAVVGWDEHMGGTHLFLKAPIVQAPLAPDPGGPCRCAGPAHP